MDLGMAIIALKLREMDLAVTLDTDEPNLALGQQEPVRRSMGNVTSAASLVFRGPVFEDPGAPLFRVAFEAGIFLGELIDFSEIPVRPGPVGSMTVGALHASPSL